MARHTPTNINKRSIPESRKLRFQDLPLVAAVLSGCAVLIGASTMLPSLLEYDRAVISGGQLFRLITGHLTHWSFDHLLWDVVMFAALGAFLERHSRRLLVATLVLSTAAISASLWTLMPEVPEYRGLSGLDSALFAAALTVAFVESLRAKHQLALTAIAILATAFMGKVAYETMFDSTLFVNSASAGFVPLPLVHAVGAAAGLLTAVAAYLPWQRTRRLVAAWNLPS